MSDFQLMTPVVLLIFNRPNTTQQVFNAIRNAKPTKLMVVADGPRLEQPEDIEKCKAAREIIKRVDWNCEVSINYSDVNLGCKKRVASGLDWVFNTVEEAIILEDDCLPHHTFFRFCEELLEYYRHDNRIAVISGANFQFGRKRTDYSYYFSRYNHCWGWATWRRSWQYFDFNMQLWPELRDGNWLHDILEDSRLVPYWTRIFQSTYEGSINSWAYRWTFSCWVQSQISILANVNLISNIGFGKEGTNTKKINKKLSSMHTESINFPLKHPLYVIRDLQSDRYTKKIIFQQNFVTKYKTIAKTFLK